MPTVQLTLPRGNLDRRLAAAAVLALIVEFWLLLSDVHFLWRPEDVSLPRAAVGHVEDVESRVMIKGPLELTWRRARSGQVLQEGDEIATLDGARATIHFDGAESVTLAPNSLLVLRHSLPAADARIFKLALVRGTILQDNAARPRSGGQFEIEVAGRKLLAGGSGAGFKIQSSGQDEPLIRLNQPPLAPEVRLEHPAASLSHPPAAEPVEAPRLSSPSDRSVLVDPESVTLKWRARGHGELLVEVARDHEFRAVVLSQLVPASQTSFAFRPEHKGRYFWRVSARGGKLSSETSVFEVERKLAMPRLRRPEIQPAEPGRLDKLRAPELKKPAVRYDSSDAGWRTRLLRVLATLADWLEPAALAADTPTPTAVGPTGGDAPEDAHGRYSVKLGWYGVPGAHAYTLQIATEPRFRHLVAEKILIDPAYQWRTNVAGFYYWRVAAVDPEGDRGPFSEFMTFEIKADRNQVGDETSYETYMQFDEYAAHEHRFRLLFGPALSYYHFSSGDTANSPAEVSYHSHTYKWLGVEYSQRLDIHYSVNFSLNTEGTKLSPANFENRKGQNQLSQNDTIVQLGVERRYFQPHYYYTLEGGIRASFTDLPVRDSESQLALAVFNFLGVYAFGSWNRIYSHDWTLTLGLGPTITYTDGSVQAGAIGRQSISKAVNEIFTIGLRLEEDFRRYWMNSDALSGRGSLFVPRAMGYVEFNF